MKCPRCKSRGETDPPDYILRQREQEVYMICPKCKYFGGSIKGKKK